MPHGHTAIEIGGIAEDIRPEAALRGRVSERNGDRRMVKLVPMPGGGAAPAIWTSHEIVDDVAIGPAVVCVLMVRNAGAGGKPGTVTMTVPKNFYEKLPEIPVEW